jgi:aryl-alcohol dehydrogenase-like predicted oxidoreductase
VLATKCGLVWYKKVGEKFFDANEHGAADKEDQEKYEVYINLRPAMIRHEIEESLRRLKTDRIDLYQTHWQDSTTKTEDTMAELMKLKQEGKIRAIGCSNATLEQMRRYQAAGQLDVDQEQYSMLQREHEADNLAFCAENQVAFLAYSPLALGILTGKIASDHEFGKGDVRRRNPWYQKENRAKVETLLNVIHSVADGKGVTVAQTVIAWTVEQAGASHALVGARDTTQAVANAKAGEVNLTDEEIKTIRIAVDQTNF